MVSPEGSSGRRSASKLMRLCYDEFLAGVGPRVQFLTGQSPPTAPRCGSWLFDGWGSPAWVLASTNTVRQVLGHDSVILS